MPTPQAAAKRLLLIHPDDAARKRLAFAIECEGLSVVLADTVYVGVERLRCDGAVGVIVVDTSSLLGGPSADAHTGMCASVRALARYAGSAQIVLLVERTLDAQTSCDLLREGVSGFVDGRGGCDNAALRRQIHAARQRCERARAKAASLHSPTAADGNTLVGQSPIMADLLNRAARTAQVSDVPILIYGESGTGKQLLAELVHQLDPKRSSRRLLSVNCSAIAGTLAESTLFGHVRGAYTGATAPRKGIFRAAEGGTVLLDEIGEMELSLQPKLLRVLQERVVMPLGSDEELDCDVRVIAATNRPLAALVERGQFRLDLFQRLNVITLEVPPLRERREDIPELVRFFAKKYAGYYAHPIESVDPQVIDFFVHSALEGNVRELENTVRQMLAFKTSGTRLELRDLPPGHLDRADRSQRDTTTLLSDVVDAASQLIDSGAMTLPQLVSEYERLVLHSTLRRSRVSSTDLAKRLGLSRRTLYNKIRKYQLSDHDRSV